MSWDPAQYHKFRGERFLPFRDLLGLIPVRPGLEVIDLGCGTGELTMLLAEHLPDSRVLGVDSSEQMLAEARKRQRPGLSFAGSEIETVMGEWDLVFSHAAIHWVEDHHLLIPHLLALVRPGGCLAVQLPSNHRHVSQTAIIETAEEEPFRSALGGWVRKSPVLELDVYAGLLHQHGGTDLTVFEKVYPHVLADSDAVAEWTAGTTLVPYFERLPSDLHAPFMDRYREKLRHALPGGPLLFPFRRILFAATRS